MDTKSLQLEILKLLKDSTISDHEKKMVQILLPVMKDSVVRRIFKALESEKKRMGNLDKKKRRIEMKYKVMVEKLCDMELNR